MNVLLTLLIVAIGPDAPTEAPTEAPYPAGAEVFRCDFGPTWDKNFDGWPDGWTREHGRGFPGYVDVKIAREGPPGSGRCLHVELDGGAAAAYSPPVEVGSLYGYVLEGLVKTAGLVHDRAYFSVVLLDERRRPLETFTSEKICRAPGFRKLRLGPFAASDQGVRYAVIGLHLEPGAKPDLNGSARFADLKMWRVPRLSLEMDSMDHVYSDPGRIEVRCRASGFTDPECPVEFELRDELGRPITQVRRKLTTAPALPEEPAAPDGTPGHGPPLVGSATWKPPVAGPGFYVVRSAIQDRRGPAQQRELTLAVIRPHQGRDGGQFGWSLPRGDTPLPLPVLGQLLGQVGINRVKFPLWYGQKASEAEVDQWIALSDRLCARGIELVGLLNLPPEEVRKQFGNGPPLEAATLFSANAEVWGPSLESVLMRLSTRVRWWQLGSDKDASFIGYPDLAGKIAGIKTRLDRTGQDVNLGMAWNWMHQMPQGPKAPWRFLALSADPPMAHEELAACLDAGPRVDWQRWVSLEPLPRGQYSIQVRATDLVQRMMAATSHGAQGVFICDPFDAQCGLMNDDGTAGELLLPWRTAALELRGTEHLGSIEMPGGSHNQIFARPDEAVMVVWNETPTEEVIYLGEHVTQIDLWGRSHTPPQQGHRQVIRVGPLPTFVVGVNKAIARWRMDFRFDRTRIPSIFGRRHSNGFQLTNGFPRGVSGSVALVVPETWWVQPRQTRFRLDAGEKLAQPFEVMPPYSADSGRHKVRVDFQVQLDRLYRFSVYRHMDVGLGDVYIDLGTRLNGRGELEIEQRLVNETDRKVSYRCQLFIPNRRRLKTQILDLGPGQNVQTYRLADGKELIGKTLWLRAAEVDGPQVLNYRFVVK